MGRRIKRMRPARDRLGQMAPELVDFRRHNEGADELAHEDWTVGLRASRCKGMRVVLRRIGKLEHQFHSTAGRTRSSAALALSSNTSSQGDHAAVLSQLETDWGAARGDSAPANAIISGTARSAPVARTAGQSEIHITSVMRCGSRAGTPIGCVGSSPDSARVQTGPRPPEF